MHPVLRIDHHAQRRVFERRPVTFRSLANGRFPAPRAAPRSPAKAHPAPRPADETCSSPHPSRAPPTAAPRPCESSTETSAVAAGICTSTVTFPDRAHASGLKTSTGTPCGTCVSMCAATVFSAFARNLIRRPAHLVVILLRVLVDHADARSRRQIVKLVERDLLPGLGQLIARIRISIQPRQRRILLRIQRPLRALPHIALVLRLRGEHAAVVLEIQLALSRWECRSSRRAGGGSW